MADQYIQSLIAKNERILLVTRQHWFVLFSAILLEIFVALVVVVAVTFATVAYPFAAFAYILILIPVLSMTRDILIWTNRQYIVTNRRVIQVSGVMNKNVVDSSLEKVNDVKMGQSFLGRIFDYGDVEILTASELGVNLFKRIGNPVRFKTAMLNAKEELEFGAREVRGQAGNDIPALIAQLDNLRKQGVLTEEEFTKKKTELLVKM